MPGIKDSPLTAHQREQVLRYVLLPARNAAPSLSLVRPLSFAFPFYPRVDPETRLFRRDDLIRYAIVHYLKAPICAIACLHLIVLPLFSFVLSFKGSSIDVSYLHDNVHSYFPSELVFDDRAAFMVLFGFGHGVVFCGTALAYALISASGSCTKYALPRRRAQLPSQSLLRRALRAGVVDSFVVVPLISYALYPVLFTHGTIPPLSSSPSSSMLAVYAQLLGCNLTNEFLFAVLHRLFHVKSLYTFHKQHHEFKGTVTLASEYSGVAETVVTNLFPNLIFGAVMGIHPAVFTTWLYWTTLESAESHCGFAWAGTWLHRLGLTHTEAAVFHDCHHTVNKGCYGTGTFSSVVCTPHTYTRCTHARSHARTRSRFDVDGPDVVATRRDGQLD